MKKIYYFLAIFYSLLCFSQTGQDKQAIANRDKYLFSTQPAARNFTETIAYKQYNGLMFIEVGIGAESYNFLFDTGAVTIISASLNEKLKLKELYHNALVDASGTQKNEAFYSLPELKIGTVTFNSVGAAVMDLKTISEQFCIRIDGIVGSNLMRSCYWKIDYKGRAITFSDKRIKASQRASTIEFEENFSGSPLLKLYYSNYNFLAIFDTGNNDAITLPENLYFSSDKGKKGILKKGSGRNEFSLYGNAFAARNATLLDSLFVGDRLFKSEVAFITPIPIPIVGNEFLARFDDVVLDWSKHKIYFSDTFKPYRALTTFGFDALFMDGKLTVSFLWDGSEAKGQGLLVGEIIESVDGVDLTNSTNESWCTFRDTSKEKAVIRITTRKADGSSGSYVLKRYTLME